MDYDLGPEAILTDWDGEDDPIDANVTKLIRALSFISNWQQSLTVTNAGKLLNYDSATSSKVQQTRAKVQAALDAWNRPELTFPGNNEINLYRQAQLAYPDTWRAVNLTTGSLPQEGFIDALEHLPGDIAGSVGGELTDIVLNFLKSFWPVLAVAVVVIVLYVFRNQIFKAR